MGVDAKSATNWTKWERHATASQQEDRTLRIYYFTMPTVKKVYNKVQTLKRVNTHFSAIAHQAISFSHCLHYDMILGLLALDISRPA